MLDENITEPQLPEVTETPAAFDDGLDEILGEATSMLAASDDEKENAGSSDVSSDEEQSSDGTPTSGQNRTERAGNKHSAQNRIAFFKRLSAEAEERADGYRLERDGFVRENQNLRTRIKEVETLLADTERHVQSLMRAAPQTGFNSGGDFDQNGVWVPSVTQNTNPNAQQPTYRENDPNRPLTFADLQKFNEQSAQQATESQKQAEAQRRYDELIRGWHPHIQNSSKNGLDPDVVHNLMKSALRDAAEAAKSGNKALTHALEIIKDLDYPVETLNALRTMPGYKNMSITDIAKNVTKLNNGLVLRKRTQTKASPSQELKSGASPAREVSSYAEYKRQKVAAAKGR